MTEELVQQFRRLEEELLAPEVRASPDRVGALLADDFVEFGRSGACYDKAAVMAALEASPGGTGEIDSFVAVELSPDLVLVRYRTTGVAPRTGLTTFAFRCSIWRLELDAADQKGGRWRMVFHQGTTTDGSHDLR